MTFIASMSASASLADPPGSSVLVAAIAWLEGTLLGTVATSLAIVAVAWVGLLMLSGRLNVRHGLTVVAGCFILFGASAIAAGIQLSMAGEDRAAMHVASEAPPPMVAPPPAPPRPAARDPYAGASVPER